MFEEVTGAESTKNDLEAALINSEVIARKVKSSETYSQHLYAALCNNSFVKNELFPILKEEYFRVSWRYAGGIVADIRGTGDYLDWYCSSSSKTISDAVAEGTVTEEIEADINAMGWKIVQE